MKEVEEFINEVHPILDDYRKGRRFILVKKERELLLKASISIGGKPFVKTCTTCVFKAMKRVVAYYDEQQIQPTVVIFHEPQPKEFNLGSKVQSIKIEELQKEATIIVIDKELYRLDKPIDKGLNGEILNQTVEAIKVRDEMVPKYEVPQNIEDMSKADMLKFCKHKIKLESGLNKEQIKEIILKHGTK